LQAFISYPETAGKTLEEIELSFAPGAPWPWNTKPGMSSLDARVQEVKEKGTKIGGTAGGTEGTEEFGEKTAV
jgi:hypothetical protein